MLWLHVKGSMVQCDPCFSSFINLLIFGCSLNVGHVDGSLVSSVIFVCSVFLGMRSFMFIGVGVGGGGV